MVDVNVNVQDSLQVKKNVNMKESRTALNKTYGTAAKLLNSLSRTSVAHDDLIARYPQLLLLNHGAIILQSG